MIRSMFSWWTVSLPAKGVSNTTVLSLALNRLPITFDPFFRCNVSALAMVLSVNTHSATSVVDVFIKAPSLGFGVVLVGIMGLPVEDTGLPPIEVGSKYSMESAHEHR
jgi:hypothetical protein